MSNSIPFLSVIIVCYNMAEEVQRTVTSFLPGYQKGASDGDIEILVMENGSDLPVPEDVIYSWPECVRYFKIEDAEPSPAWALNAGVEKSEGTFVCPVIDGARLASPGLFQAAKNISKISKAPFITCLGYHIGSMPQQLNPEHDRDTDRQLLKSIDWPMDPGRLFEIASLGQSAKEGLLGFNSEANAPVLSRETYQELGGFDERFALAGGGFVNLDFFQRATQKTGVDYYLLLNEGTFHQFHGGVTTTHEKNTNTVRSDLMKEYSRDYKAVTGTDFKRNRVDPFVFGKIDNFTRQSIIKSVEFNQRKYSSQ